MRMLLTILCCITLLPLHAFKNIEHTKQEIIATLQITNPAIVGEFRSFCAQYDQVVFTFFDTDNYAPLTKHIELMEKNLATLQKVSENPEYKTVRHLLTDLKQHLTNMISLLTKYVGSKNILSLGNKLRKFRNLLPPSVSKRGDVSLLWSLHHRLGC